MSQPAEARDSGARSPIKLTYADYAELPSDGKRYQILDGELNVTPAPIPRHQQVVGELHLLLAPVLRQTGQVFISPIDVLLGDHNILQPDIVYIGHERAHILGPKNIQGAPDLVVEVLSASTRRVDVLVKSAIYARHKVPSYWIADPDLDRLEIHQLDDDGAYQQTRLYQSPQVAEPPDYPELHIPLKQVFDR